MCFTGLTMLSMRSCRWLIPNMEATVSRRRWSRACSSATVSSFCASKAARLYSGAADDSPMRLAEPE